MVKDDNVIFIGSKPFMNYVSGVVMQFTTQDSKEVIVKARGNFISRAVDVTLIVTKNFLEGQVEIKDIKIDTEELENKKKKMVKVSTIELTLAKKK
ncbi:DNA-binding protein Alba [Candidatus Woesearchaeota archaeon]|nr:DNA-binding protein Alba [Candidatus Woesearchaeota archaeon]